MKLLIAHNDYGRPSGEEHALETLARIAQRQGHGVVWLRRSSAEIDQTALGKVKAFFAGVANPWMARRMAALLEAEKPDLVLVQNLYPLLSPSILAPCSRLGIPVMMRCPNYRLFCPNGLHLCHGEICERCLGGREYWCVLRNCERDLFKSTGYALRGWAARVTRRILDHVDLFIVLSEFQRQRFLAQGVPPERVEILPNMTPSVPGAERTASSGEKRDLTPPHATVEAEREVALRFAPGAPIAFVGRASPEKGIEDFVEAARRLPDLPFAVAGATERMPWLVRESPPNLRWLGFLRGRDLDAFYLGCRMLVCPSRCFEGFPNAVAQAMMWAKPVVASRLGVLAEIVEDDRTGLLFEPRNVSDLVQKIQTLVYDPGLCARLGTAGRQKALRDYSEEVVARRFEEICRKARSVRRIAQSAGRKAHCAGR